MGFDLGAHNIRRESDVPVRALVPRHGTPRRNLPGGVRSHTIMIDVTALNPQQRLAVTHGDGPLLVLAGAGSGKTRVITYRIAWLIGERGVHPSRILAVTFTNKAAAEMLHRVQHLVPDIGGRPWIGTFHSTSLRMLRRDAHLLGYPKSFVVYDT